MADGGAQQQLGRQWRAGRVVTLLDRGEPDDDVGAAALRADERRRFRLAAVQFGEHLIPGVAALGRIPPYLPLPADLLRWVQVDGHVEARRGQPGVQRQQPLDDDEPPRLDVFRPGELAGVMVIDGFEDRVACGKQLQLLLHDVDVVAVRVQGRKRKPLALRPVIAVVVVHAHGRALVLAQGPDEARGDRRLARGAVAGDREHDRAVSSRRRGAGPVHAEELVRHAVTLRIWSSRTNPPGGGTAGGNISPGRVPRGPPIVFSHGEPGPCASSWSTTTRWSWRD